MLIGIWSLSVFITRLFMCNLHEVSLSDAAWVRQVVSTAAIALQGKGPVFLMAATLRPETMYGQTNCWALPTGDYGAFRGLNGEVYVLAARAARNLSYQDRLPETGKPELLLSIKGQDLIGVPLTVSTSIAVCMLVMQLCLCSCQVAYQRLQSIAWRATSQLVSAPGAFRKGFAAYLPMVCIPQHWLMLRWRARCEGCLAYDINTLHLRQSPPTRPLYDVGLSIMKSCSLRVGMNRI